MITHRTSLSLLAGVAAIAASIAVFAMGDGPAHARHAQPRLAAPAL